MKQKPSTTDKKPSAQHTVVIVGGGFGGVRCALDLAAKKPRTMRIVLMSNRQDLQYYGATYRLIAGHSPTEVTIPLALLLKGKNVELVVDGMTGADLQKKTLTGESGTTYGYDQLVLALGSEVAYFGIPGMQEHALTFKGVQDALAIKRHLHSTISNIPKLPKEEQTAAGHFVVIGGGASGIEVASEFATQGRKLAQKYGVDPSLITVDLIEALPRLMPMLPEAMSTRVTDRLRALGVDLYFNYCVQKAEKDTVFLADITIHAKTLVWTAGVKANSLLSTIAGLELDKRGRAIVDDHLRAKGQKDVFVIGDCAATQYSGMAQTTVYDGDFVARTIVRMFRGKPTKAYVPRKPAIALPVGDGWGAVEYLGIRFYGTFGWFLRQAADLCAFLMIMSPLLALKVYRRRSKMA